MTKSRELEIIKAALKITKTELAKRFEDFSKGLVFSSQDWGLWKQRGKQITKLSPFLS